MINGKKVYLKELSSDNIEELYLQWINDKELTRFMAPKNKHYTIVDLQQYVKGMNISRNNH